MTNEVVVLLGLGIISFIFSYFSSMFLEVEDFWSKFLGQIFFTISVLFLLIILNCVVLIIYNDSSLSYLKGSVADVALQIFLYLFMFAIASYIVYIFYQIFTLLKLALKEGFSRGKG